MTAKAPVVLLVERMGEGMRTLERNLLDRGIRVIRADAGPDTVDLSRLYQPDVVVVDGRVESVVAGLIARPADERGPRPPLLLAAPGDPALREALRRRLGPLYFSARLVDPDRLLEVILSLLGPDRMKSPPRRKAPALLMCVDDDPLFLKSLSRTLTLQGHRVVPCGNASEALQVLSRVGPDLAFVDLMMPGMDGLALTEALGRRKEGRLPVVLLSALDTDEARYESHSRGASLYLTKPCDSQKLRDAVDYLIGDLDDAERRALRARI